MSGIFLDCESHLPEGTVCDISINLDGGIQQIGIHARGTVVRQEPKGMAVQFTEVLGGDSFGHLQNLVRYNSGHDIDQVEQELGNPVGLKSAN